MTEVVLGLLPWMVDAVYEPDFAGLKEVPICDWSIDWRYYVPILLQEKWERLSPQTRGAVVKTASYGAAIAGGNERAPAVAKKRDVDDDS